METKKQKVFKKGDKLWHPSRGWGIVDSLHENREESIDISFKGCLRCVMGEDISLLSFTEYSVNANHTRPFEDGDVVYGAKKGWGVENIAIYRDEDSTYFHWDMSRDSIRHWGVPVGPDSILATEDQKQLLFDRLAQDNLRWNEKTRRLEELDEPKVGDDVIMWNNTNPSESATIDILGEIKGIDNGFRYYGWANVTYRCIKWDGTKEHLDSVRNGIIK